MEHKTLRRREARRGDARLIGRAGPAVKRQSYGFALKMHKTTFTLAEAANLLRCHKETLRRAILDGSLQAARLGRGYRISRTDLQSFWTERGGGELFDKRELAQADAQEEKQAEESAKAKKGGRKNRDEGPRQFSLPIA